MPVRARPSASIESLECAGIARDPPKVEDQVRLLARALGSFPASVADARRPSKPQGRVRFPGGGLVSGLVLIVVLGVWRTRTRLCEGRGPGSIPGEDMALRGRVEALWAPEPDGRAAVCKTA